MYVHSITFFEISTLFFCPRLHACRYVHYMIYICMLYYYTACTMYVSCITQKRNNLCCILYTLHERPVSQINPKSHTSACSGTTNEPCTDRIIEVLSLVNILPVTHEATTHLASSPGPFTTFQCCMLKSWECAWGMRLQFTYLLIGLLYEYNPEPLEHRDCTFEELPKPGRRERWREREKEICKAYGQST